MQGTSAAPTSDLEAIEVTVADGVATVVLDRPEVMNAFDERMLEELSLTWTRLRRDDAVRVVVLTGRGDRAFCSGYDRSGIDEDGGDGLLAGSTAFSRSDPGDHLGPKTCGLWKPVIAAVNGLACGGAFYLLGEADLILAADHATFFDPHLSFGMPAVLEPMHLLQRMPIGEVLRLALLGSAERMSAATAKEVGLVTEVVPGAELLAAAGWMADVIAAAPTRSVQATVRSIWLAQEVSRSQAIAMGGVLVDAGTDPAGFADGQAAFRSKQKQQWRLR